MSVFYQPGQELASTDLRIFLKDRTGAPMDVLDILYSIYYYDTGAIPQDWITIPDQYHRTPQSGPATGQYWADWNIPNGVRIGRYQIRWDFRNSLSDPYQQIRSDFTVVKFPRGTYREAIVTDLPGTPIVIVL